MPQCAVFSGTLRHSAGRLQTYYPHWSRTCSHQHNSPPSRRPRRPARSGEWCQTPLLFFRVGGPMGQKGRFDQRGAGAMISTPAICARPPRHSLAEGEGGGRRRRTGGRSSNIYPHTITHLQSPTQQQCRSERLVRSLRLCGRSGFKLPPLIVRVFATVSN